MKAHGAQLRASGDPYFSHPVEVAGILAEMKLDTASIVTGLLHDTVEDTVATLDDIDRVFGHEIARLVDGVTKLSRHRAAIRPHQAGRELPQAGARDVRGHPGAAGQARRPSAQHADPAFHQRAAKSAGGSRARRWTSTRRSPSGSACSG